MSLSLSLILSDSILSCRCSTLRPPTSGKTFGALLMTYANATAVTLLIPWASATSSNAAEIFCSSSDCSLLPTMKESVVSVLSHKTWDYTFFDLLIDRKPSLFFFLSSSAFLDWNLPPPIASQGAIAMPKCLHIGMISLSMSLKMTFQRPW